MKSKRLWIYTLFLSISLSTHAQFRIGTTDYASLDAAVAAVPTTGVLTTIDVMADHTMSTAVTINSDQHILLKGIDGSSFTLKRDASLLTYLITIQNDAILILENVVIDGGAVWSDGALTVHADTTRTNSGIMADNPLILLNADGKLTLNHGACLQNNHNTGSGDCGAIRSSGVLTLNNGSVIRLCSFIPAGATTGKNAGAICSVDVNSVLTMNGNAMIAGCMSYVNADDDAGAVFCGDSSNMIMNDKASIYGCYSNNVGGGVTQLEKKLTMNGSASIHHCMSRAGGAVVAYNQAIVEMNGNSSLHNNESLTSGGAMQLLSNAGGAASTLRMKDNSSLYNNKAAKEAGGIMNTSGRIYMYDHSGIRNNQSGTDGGGVYLLGTSSDRGQLYLAGGRISHNAAIANHGGGVYIASYASSHISGGEISYNTAKESGGGLYASGEEDTAYVSAGKIAGNKAPRGAGIELDNKAVLTMTGGELSGNQATLKGGGLYINAHATDYPVANIIDRAMIRNNTAPHGNGIYMAADKSGGQASIFNLGGAVEIQGEIFLEKDTLNPAPSGDPIRNKFITLVSPPLNRFTLVTDVFNDSPYGRIVVVPGTVTAMGKTYTLTDATPYAAKFTHNVKPVVAGLPTTVTDKKLILGCYDPNTVVLRRIPIGKPAKVNVPHTFSLENLSSSISAYEWEFPDATPVSSTSASPTVVWDAVGLHQIRLKLYEKGVSYAPGDTMRCDVLITRTLQVNEKNLHFFVNKNAVSGQQTGLSWKDAFLNIDTALYVAGKGDCVWVAEGVYTPLAGSFVMAYDSVEMYGGFGGTESYLEERNIATHATILQGRDSSVIKIDGNRIYSGGSCGISRGARWDGFIITGGKDKRGAGIYNDNGSPTIVNCIIRGNAAVEEGGGVYTLSRGTCATGSPLFVNTEVSGNTAKRGAGFYNEGGRTELLNVTISGNYAMIEGAGLYNDQTSGVKIQNTIIYDNRTKAEQKIPNIVNRGTDTYYRFSLIEGASLPGAWSWLGVDGGHNVSGDPAYNKPGFDAEGTMISGDYRLNSTKSQAFDRGRNTLIHDYPKDLSGNERVYNSRVDIGAYEFVPNNTPPSISRSIVIGEYEHVTTNPPKGIYQVIGHKNNFSMTLMPEDGYSLENVIITTGSKWQDEKGGMQKTMNKDGSVTVIFRDVMKPLNVQLSGIVSTASLSVEDVGTLWTAEGCLHIQTDRPRRLQIYTVMGTLSYQQNIPVGKVTVPLAKGLYIIKLDDKVQKVVVK